MNSDANIAGHCLLDE